MNDRQFNNSHNSSFWEYSAIPQINLAKEIQALKETLRLVRNKKSKALVQKRITELETKYPKREMNYE